MKLDQGGSEDLLLWRTWEKPRSEHDKNTLHEILKELIMKNIFEKSLK